MSDVPQRLRNPAARRWPERTGGVARRPGRRHPTWPCSARPTAPSCSPPRSSLSPETLSPQRPFRSPHFIPEEVPLTVRPPFRRRPPSVYLRAPGAPDAWEVIWYSERLADLSLLDAAVVAVVDRVGYLAVPVSETDGQRRGGFLAVDDRLTARCLRSALLGRPASPQCACGGPATAECATTSSGARPRRTPTTTRCVATSTDTASRPSTGSSRRGPEGTGLRRGRPTDSTPGLKRHPPGRRLPFQEMGEVDEARHGATSANARESASTHGTT
ncbi:hypothetical protein STENM36S_01143 [Streptomyces tendae]